ncbi:MAG: YkgJ family cysteine cluster protein [Proteobacteria bacterium]|nr:YkgJ family cysteine cluster protein [Pseudomonadota bacterium]
MNPDCLSHLLKNYFDLLSRVDAHIQKVEKNYPGMIACKKGCDSCCRPITLFPVEAVALSAAFGQLDKFSRELVLAGMEKNAGGCPLLINRQCLLYGARPIICRTHGYPIYFREKTENRVDFCPKNFKRVTFFPRDDLLDLEQLNVLLTTINKQFRVSIETPRPLADRIPVSNALGLLDEIKGDWLE